MKYIIMCGGYYPDQKELRHLQIIKDEPIVARTIRLLNEHGIDDIAISAQNSAFLQFGVPVLEHENNFGHGGKWLEAFYPTEDPVCYIFGDVIFSPEAIRVIVETETTDIDFFASAPPFASEYRKNWAEPFAYKVINTELFRSCINVAKHYSDIGLFKRTPIAWELWQIIKGTALNKVDYTNYIAINDYTCDCDSAEDLKYMEGVVK